VLLIAPGNLHDVMMAPDPLSAAGPIRRLIADKAYAPTACEACWQNSSYTPSSLPRQAQAADPLRPQSLSPAQPDRAHVLPPQGLPAHPTRHDKLARNFLAGALLAAAITWWT
jgi:hypothetical protein